MNSQNRIKTTWGTRPPSWLCQFTSRPLLLSAVAETTRHARQGGLRVSSSHAKAGWDLKAHHPAHQTFAHTDALDTAIHDAVTTLNDERSPHPLAKLRIS